MGLPEELYNRLFTLRDVSEKHGIPLKLHVLHQQDLTKMLLDWRDDEKAMFRFADENLPEIRDLVLLRLPLPVADECHKLMHLLLGISRIATITASVD